MKNVIIFLLSFFCSSIYLQDYQEINEKIDISDSLSNKFEIEGKARQYTKGIEKGELDFLIN